jgi:hypothetical protein
MGWRDILKNKDRDLAQELLISFREFTPIREITKEEEDMFLSSMYYSTKPLVYKRTLEFMKPFDEIERDGLDFVFKFDIYGVPFTFKMPVLPAGLTVKGIGERAEDTFPVMDSTQMSFCVKANRVMTNGDFMVTLLLASKNNQLPTILTLPAYVERHMPETKMHNDTHIYDINEHSYKDTLLERIWEHVLGLDEIDWPVLNNNNDGEIPLNILNEWLKEYIPEELLEGW